MDKAKSSIQNFFLLLVPIEFNCSNCCFIWGTRATEAQFQIKEPDPYPLLKGRTDLGMLVVLSASSSVTSIHAHLPLFAVGLTPSPVGFLFVSNYANLICQKIFFFCMFSLTIFIYNFVFPCELTINLSLNQPSILWFNFKAFLEIKLFPSKGFVISILFQIQRYFRTKLILKSISIVHFSANVTSSD